MGDTCSNEELSSEARMRNTVDYIKLKDSVQDKDQQINQLQKDLDDEIERSEELSSANEKLTEQIKDLDQQLSQYKDQNIDQNQAQYDNANIRQLLQEKQVQLASVEQKFNASQQKVDELQKNLDTETRAHKQMKQELEQQLVQYQSLQTKYQYVDCVSSPRTNLADDVIYTITLHRDIETQRDELLTQSKESKSSMEDQQNENAKILQQLESTKTKYDELCEENQTLKTKQNEIKKELRYLGICAFLYLYPRTQCVYGHVQ